MKRIALTLVIIALSACAEPNGSVGPPGTGHVEVSSDPSGARILVDNVDRRRITTDTVHGLSGRHSIAAVLDSAGNRYAYLVQVDVRPDSVLRINGPLMLSRCGTTCGNVTQHTANRVAFGRSPAGPLFYGDGVRSGLTWPGATGNRYSSIGVPLIAGLLNGTDTISVGIYNTNYMVGRPFPSVGTTAAGSFMFKQSYWLLPPAGLLDVATMRGIEVQEEVIGSSAQEDVVLVKVTYRNVTNRPAYRAADPYAMSNGFTFERVYLGFGLDADVGVAEDDLFTYAPELNAVVTYDAAFREDEFFQGFNTRPGVVGMRLVNAPAGTRRVLNGWGRVVGGGASGDWAAGTSTERFGHSLLSGRLAHSPDHADDTIGHQPGSSPNDYRMSVSAGPITLAPGDSASITVAIAVAEPVTGTFVTGTIIDSGDPRNTTRPIMRVLANVLDKLRLAETIR